MLRMAPLALLPLLLVACGDGVAIRSAAVTGLSLRGSDPARESAAAATDFKLCVKRVRLENEKGEVEKDGDKEDLEFAPGLIDLTGGAAKDWGEIEDVPTGFLLKRLRVKVHQDKDLCGVDYSVRYGSGAETSQDVEFKFLFEPPVELKSGDTLTLGFQRVVDTLAANPPNSANLKTKIEDVEGTATK